MCPGDGVSLAQEGTSAHLNGPYIHTLGVRRNIDVKLATYSLLPRARQAQLNVLPSIPNMFTPAVKREQ